MGLLEQMAADAAMPTNMDTKQIAALVEEDLEVQDRIAALELDLKKARDKHRKLTEMDIPAAMQEAGGVAMIKLANGHTVEVKEVIAARIPVAQQGQAYGWLRKHGFEDLIKNDIIVGLGKGDDEVAKAVGDYLESVGIGYQRKESVHYQTLGAFVREQDAAGAPVPEDIFGVYRGLVATIK